MGLVMMDELSPDRGAAVHCSANLGIQSGAWSDSFPARNRTSLFGTSCYMTMNKYLFGDLNH